MPALPDKLGNAHGVISIDTSPAKRAAIELKRVGREMGVAFKPVETTIKRLQSDLKALRRGIAALGAGAGIATVLGVNAARDIRAYRIQFEALLGDEKEAADVMRTLTDQANRFGIEVNEVFQLGRSLIPVLEDGAESLDVWVKRAALLASTNPLKGTTDAVRAIQEFLAGQPISIQRLFNIDPNLIKEAQDMFTDAGEQLDFILGRMGATEDAATAMANEFVTLTNEIKLALATAFTPLLETLGPIVRQFTEMIAGLRETNPELLTFGAGLVSVVAVGAPLLLFLIKVIDSLKMIKALSIAPTLGKAGVFGAAVAGGAAAGVGAVRAVGRATGDERLQKFGIKDAFETLKQALFVVTNMLTQGVTAWVVIVSKGVSMIVKAFANAADGIGEFVQFLGEKLHSEDLVQAGENISAFADSLKVATDVKLSEFVAGAVESQRALMEKFTQVLFPPEVEAAAGDGGGAAGMPGGTIRVVADEALEIFEEYQAERLSIEEENERARNEIIAQAGRERERLEQQILDAVIAHNRQEAQIEQDYYRNRLQRAQAAGLEMARMEEDHQRQIRRMREDSEARQDVLIGSRDALGLVRERRKHEIERQRAEEDHGVNLSRRNANFALEMAQMEQQFQIQRARREEAFTEQQSQLAEELEFVRAKRDEELELLKNATTTQLNDLKNAALQRIAIIDSTLVAGLGVVTQSAATAGQMLAWLNAQRAALGAGPSRPTPRRRAKGGYASGLVLTGEEGIEFVLDAKTTKAAEAMVGSGKLTQGNVLGAGGGRGGSKTVNQNFTFHGDMSADMKQWYRRIARAETESVLAGVMG